MEPEYERSNIESPKEPSYLNLMALIGFNEVVIDGLILHPDNETIIFPIGNQIIVLNVLTRQDQFLKGHSNYISSMTLSNSGCYLT